MTHGLLAILCPELERLPTGTFHTNYRRSYSVYLAFYQQDNLCSVNSRVCVCARARYAVATYGDAFKGVKSVPGLHALFTGKSHECSSDDVIDYFAY